MTTLTLNENGFAAGHRAREYQRNQDKTGLLDTARQVLEVEGRELHATGKAIWQQGKELLASISSEESEKIQAIYRDTDDARFEDQLTGDITKEDLTTKPFVFPLNMDETTPELLALREKIFQKVA